MNYFMKTLKSLKLFHLEDLGDQQEEGQAEGQVDQNL